MPKFLEEKLKRKYGAKSAVPYKIMNSIGAMRGNKETAKGRAMEKKHEATEGKTQRDTESHTYNFRNRHGQAKIT